MKVLLTLSADEAAALEHLLTVLDTAHTVPTHQAPGEYAEKLQARISALLDRGPLRRVRAKLRDTFRPTRPEIPSNLFACRYGKHEPERLLTLLHTLATEYAGPARAVRLDGLLKHTTRLRIDEWMPALFARGDAVAIGAGRFRCTCPKCNPREET